jgi:SAM-dependent methyltransferase
MNDLTSKESHFAFGKNWLDYADKIDEPRIVQAMADLQRLNSSARFNGKSFLDIGCGSGIHALAALRLGAASVTCVDIDPDSVAATSQTLQRFAPGAQVTVRVQSIFDMTPDNCGQFDVVYSWGVLHHTGAMHRAIAAAAGLVAADGVLILALYRKTPFCWMWRHIKKWYTNTSPIRQQKFMNGYIAITHRLMRFRGVDVEAKIANYGQSRGMNYYNDVHDWLGGFPYESISPKNCIELLSKLCLELKYSKTLAVNAFGIFGSGCDEYTFKKS